MKNIKQKVAFIITLIIFGGLFLGFVIIPLNDSGESREGLRPRTGIGFGHSEHIIMDSISFYFITTINPNQINISYANHFLNTAKNGTIAIVLPYSGKLDPSNSDWNMKPFDHMTVLIKKYNCSIAKPCYNDDAGVKPVTFYLDSKIDSKRLYSHDIKVKFDSAVGNPAFDYIYDSTTKDDQILFQYNNTVTKRQATIIIDETADNIRPIPIPEPDIFHNSANDYSNTQLDWHLIKDQQTFFVDYEIPTEREAYEKSQSSITVFSIFLGLVGIGLAFIGGRISV